MKLHPLLTACAALLALCPTLATAQTSAVPGFISYQGRVVDAAGANVGAGTPVNRTVIFRIWDSPSSTNTANLIYSESQTVTVSDGEFSVLVGQGVANTTQTFGYSEAGADKKLVDFSTAFNRSTLYLGVTVAAAATIATTDNEITPRQQIVSTAFAMRSKVAESVDASAITTAMLANNAVTTTQVGDAAITTSKLAANAVTTTQITNATITGAKIATDTIVAGNIQAGAVGTSEILDGTIATADIANLAVTNAKIATDTILAGNIAADAVGASEIAAGAVGTSEIADATVTGTDIAAGTITKNKLAADVGVWSVAAGGIYTGSRVSIGDPPSILPMRAPFEVNTWGVGNNLGTSWRIYNSFVSTVENQQLSIYAALDVSARQYYVRSDARIKKINGRSSGLDDLASLMGIEVTDYQFRDIAVNGSGKQKKVIAQQVESVFPQAVSKSCDVVPDIYIKAAVKDGWIELKTDLKKGERVRLIAQEADGIFEVLEVSKDRFRTQLKPEGGEVFVFGREVNDFRTVDYDAIAMLNVSATQQIKREKDAEIQTLRDENATLRRELAAKEASLETRLIALERRMAQGVATETVSLKTERAAK